MFAKSTVKLNMPAIKQLDRAAVQALEMTGEAIHTDLQQSQTMPFDVPTEQERARGKTSGGTLQNESTFVDDSRSGAGRISIVSSTPYARRLYYHPEYNFDKGENPNAGGAWFEPYLKGGEKQDFAQKAFAKLYKRQAGI